MPDAALRDTLSPLIWAECVPSVSSSNVALFFTLLTRTAAPISTLALPSVFFTVNCRASSFVVEAVIRVLADTLTEPSGPFATGAAVITAFFPMVTLASFLLETTPTLAPRPKADVCCALFPPALVPCTLSWTFWMPVRASWVCASWVLLLVSAEASPITPVGSTDLCSLPAAPPSVCCPSPDCCESSAAGAVLLPPLSAEDDPIVLSTVSFRPV